MLATPVDFRHMGPLADVFARRRHGRRRRARRRRQRAAAGRRPGLPDAEADRRGHPVRDLWEKLWSDEYVAAYQAMTGWSDDHIPFPGAAARETAQMLVRDNGMVNDRLVVGGDRVHLARHHGAVPDRAGQP